MRGQPASSAVGMYQMTDAAFADARHYCIRHHTVIEDEGWSIWHSCWFNAFYSRVLPSHAIELTAVSLERNVAQILARRPNVTASSPQKEDLATIIHLCGAGPATTFARRGFRLLSGERCGDYSVAFYLAEVNASGSSGALPPKDRLGQLVRKSRMRDAKRAMNEFRVNRLA